MPRSMPSRSVSMYPSSAPGSAPRRVATMARRLRRRSHEVEDLAELLGGARDHVEVAQGKPASCASSSSARALRRSVTVTTSTSSTGVAASSWDRATHRLRRTFESVGRVIAESGVGLLAADVGSDRRVQLDGGVDQSSAMRSTSVGVRHSMPWCEPMTLPRRSTSAHPGLTRDGCHDVHVRAQCAASSQFAPRPICTSSGTSSSAACAMRSRTTSSSTSDSPGATSKIVRRARS